MSNVNWSKATSIVAGVGEPRVTFGGVGYTSDIVMTSRFMLVAYKGKSVLKQWGVDHTETEAFPWESATKKAPLEKTVLLKWWSSRPVGTDRLCCVMIEYVVNDEVHPVSGELLTCYDGKTFSQSVHTENKGTVTCGPGQVAYQHPDGSWGCKPVNEFEGAGSKGYPRVPGIKQDPCPFGQHWSAPHKKCVPYKKQARPVAPYYRGGVTQGLEGTDMSAVKWSDDNQGSALGLGQGEDDLWSMLGSSRPVPKPSRVQWLGAAESGLTVDQLKQTNSYKTCYTNAVQKCYKAYPDPQQFQDCIQGSEQLCLQLADKDEAAKKSGGAASQTSAQITNLQNTINAALTKLGICNIGVDGKIGPTTCRAAEYLAKQGMGIYVPGICSSKPGAGSFDPKCKLGQKAPPVSPCAACTAEQDCVDEKCVPKCGSGQQRGADGKCAAVKTAAGGETPWGLFALGAAALGAIGLAFVKAPKLPAREADVARDNPGRRKKSRRRAA